MHAHRAGGRGDVDCDRGQVVERRGGGRGRVDLGQLELVRGEQVSPCRDRCGQRRPGCVDGAAGAAGVSESDELTDHCGIDSGRKGSADCQPQLLVTIVTIVTRFTVFTVFTVFAGRAAQRGIHLSLQGGQVGIRQPPARAVHLGRVSAADGERGVDAGVGPLRDAAERDAGGFEQLGEVVPRGATERKDGDGGPAVGVQGARDVDALSAGLDRGRGRPVHLDLPDFGLGEGVGQVQAGVEGQRDDHDAPPITVVRRATTSATRSRAGRR